MVREVQWMTHSLKNALPTSERKQSPEVKEKVVEVLEVLREAKGQREVEQLEAQREVEVLREVLEVPREVKAQRGLGADQEPKARVQQRAKVARVQRSQELVEARLLVVEVESQLRNQ